MSEQSKTFYFIQGGSLHQGGDLMIELLSKGKLRLEFAIKKRTLVPVPDKYLKGSYQLDIPSEFSREEGYLALENQKSREWGPLILSHQGRVDFYHWTNCHCIEVQLKNGKAQGEILFHPEMSGCGWIRISLTIHSKLPLLQNYNLEAIVKN